MVTEAPLLRTACDRCHKRKQRCLRSSPGNEDDPCRRCEEAGEMCVFSPPCRLGRPTKISKQQRQDQDNNHSVQDIEVTGSSHTTRAPSQLHLLKSQSLEYGKRKSRPQTPHAGSRHHSRQSGRLDRPQRSQLSPSTPPLDSPFSSASTSNILDETVSSTASVPSSAPSLDVFTDYLRDSTKSLQQIQSAPTQYRIQQPYYTYPTSVPQKLYPPAFDHYSISTRTAKLSSIHRMWNVPQEIPNRVQDGYHLGDTLSHKNDALSHMPSAHSGIPQQSCETISPSPQIHLIGQATLPSDATSKSISHNQQSGRANLSQPLTPPPPFSPAGHVECIEDHTSGALYPGFIYSQVEEYHVGNPWLDDTAKQYHALFGKLTVNPIITPATLAQNYQLQPQLTPTGSVNAMPGDWLRTPMHYQ